MKIIVEEAWGVNAGREMEDGRSEMGALEPVATGRAAYPYAASWNF